MRQKDKVWDALIDRWCDNFELIQLAGNDGPTRSREIRRSLIDSPDFEYKKRYRYKNGKKLRTQEFRIIRKVIQIPQDNGQMVMFG